MLQNSNIVWFNQLSIQDVPQVGGKNASLGEMLKHLTSAGVRVPNGFATTALAYRNFLKQKGLDEKINATLAKLNVEDINALAEAGRTIRRWIMATPFLSELTTAIEEAYAELSTEINGELRVAVRSSATAEDLPEASFAGQQETFLNVSGFDNVIQAIKSVFASLFNDRAIAYRVHHGFEHSQIALSAGIQHMVRSDLASSGVAFTLDTETGFKDVVLITSSYGLGETVVQGAVNPDEFYVHKSTLLADKPAILQRNLGSKAIKMIFNDVSKQHEENHYVATVDVPETERLQFSLTDAEIATLAKQAIIIEKHYGRPMDVEWARDGVDGNLYILQARPETVKSREQDNLLQRYQLEQRGEILVTGRSIGERIGKGVARVIKNITAMDQVQAGDVLVTDMTDPDWEPIMKRASAIVTNRGGRTCHAAIIARELGIPAVVGCNTATKDIRDGQAITVSCAEGDTGFIYDGLLDYEIKRIGVDHMPKLPVKITMNVGNPTRAFAFQNIPNDGVGLARLEFIINNMIGIHPKALLNFQQLPSDVKEVIKAKIAGYESPVSFYIEKLREGIATLAAAFHPKPVIVRLSDFKSNEYANLLGGHLYEPHEENPMLGFRGASRYLADAFRDCFELECIALRKVRNEMGLTNVQVMVPFVRTVEEGKGVVDLLAQYGLKRGDNDLKLIMMCEVPSNVILAEEFLEHFDGFSIGSNDLTQLTLGLDRDSGVVAKLFDERNEAIKRLLHQVIQTCRQRHKYIGICGQGPSDYPDFALWLVQEGIESLSLNPDSVLSTYMELDKTLKTLQSVSSTANSTFG